MPGAIPFPYVYVNADGTARELHPNEQRYLTTEFKGGDGAAPYVKSRYDQRNGWGDLAGYLQRDLLPPGTQVHHAPAEDPHKSLSQAEQIAWLRSKGVEVVENENGSFTMRAKPQR
jgi:hypothetical protein